MHLKTIVLFGLVLATLLVVSSSSSTSQDAPVEKKRHIPKLFDFANYKALFKKKYHSLREELVRAKLFLARAFRVLISGIAYKHKTSSFYLAINRRSDWTPKELAKSIPKIRPFANLDENGKKLDKYNRRPKDDKSTANAFKPVLVDEKDIENELDTIDKEAMQKGDKVYATISNEVKNLESQESAKNTRKRRDLSSGKSAENLRDFSFDNLIKNPDKVKPKKDDPLASNNPNYEPPEVISMGADKPDQSLSFVEMDELLDESYHDAKEEIEAEEEDNSIEVDDYDYDDDYVDAQEDIPLDAKEDAPTAQGYFGAVLNWFRGQSVIQNEETDDKEKLPDEVFVDHSQKCMPEVKSQGDCGSCYAFTMISFYEWLLCMQTGKLVRLSEQYILDCALDTEFKYDLDGCDGGMMEEAAGFFEKYGLELSRNYPYVGREGTCPYEPMIGNNKTGYFRLTGKAGVNTVIPYDEFALQLELSPIAITVGPYGSFQEYGGGIHRNSQCCKTFSFTTCGEHAMVLVGHGREDGEEYWLIRNSFGEDFGEDGYYRLSKESDCVWPKYGLVYSFEKFDDEERLNVEINRNHHRSDKIQSKIDDLSRYEAPNRRGIFWQALNYASELLAAA